MQISIIQKLPPTAITLGKHFAIVVQYAMTRAVNRLNRSSAALALMDGKKLYKLPNAKKKMHKECL